MYTTYWHLEKKPFECGSDPEFYYPGESHQAALLKLRYAIENRRGAALLTGASGLGKTLLVHSLQRMAPEMYAPFVHLVFPKMSGAELLGYFACELNPDIEKRTRSVDANIRAIEKALWQNAHQGQHAVLVIDEAQLLDETEGLEIVRLLLNFQYDGQPALTVLLAGQPALLPTLDRLSALEERFAIKCLLRPLNLEETISYVHHRLKAAGAQRAIFENDSLEALHHITGGVPRQINRLCDLALLIGFAEQLTSITTEQLESVSQELVTVMPE